MTSSQRRFYMPPRGPEGEHEALVRAFLWLKRRIEEGRTSGVLAVPSPAFVDGPLKEALGWRLVDVLKGEGSLPLGPTLRMSWQTFETIGDDASRPIAALFPDVARVERLASWRGPALVVASGEELDRWVKRTGATEPPPENFWPPT